MTTDPLKPIDTSPQNTQAAGSDASAADFEDRPPQMFNERYLLAAILLFVGTMGAFDLFEDGIDGVPLDHLLLEASIIIGSVMGLFILVRRTDRRIRLYGAAMQTRLFQARQDAEQWRTETAGLMAGVGEAMQHQFDRWKLTEAERDVAELLLKGLSHREIAEVRGTSERTVRHQAAAVYEKSNLVGRVELSAFFLEDLFPPRTAKTI